MKYLLLKTEPQNWSWRDWLKLKKPNYRMEWGKKSSMKIDTKYQKKICKMSNID